MNASITSGQKQRRRSIKSVAEKALGSSSSESDQERDDRLIVQSLLEKVPSNCEGSCEGFCLQNAFILKVPENYDHDNHLWMFRRNHSHEFGDYNKEITDKHFAKVTNRLVPGKAYLGKIFMFHFFKNADKAPDNDDCLSFLKSQNAILCGAQGLSLAWQYAREEFPPIYLFSFDEKDALWQSEGNIMVPVIRNLPANCWTFGLMDYGDGKKFHDIRVLCVCEMPHPN